ncbi:hypothetical protein MRB53_042201 [Persea americana]|nr:hypothetical protein MRB53_042201 [Persea americana]
MGRDYELSPGVRCHFPGQLLYHHRRSGFDAARKGIWFMLLPRHPGEEIDADGREELDERRGIERLGSDPVAERDFGDDCYGFGGSVETELDVHLLVWGGVRDR